MPVTGRIANIATTAELLAAGISERHIASLVRRGDLIRVGHGAYAEGPYGRKLLAHAGGDQLLATAAALAVIGPRAVASHHSAAYLHEIDVIGRPAQLASVTCPPGRRRHGRAGVQVHVVSLPAEQVTAVLGLPVTTAARTVADLAMAGDFRAGLVAADSALHRKLTTKAELSSVLSGCALWPGVQRAAEVVEFADKRAESPLESIARVAFRDCDLPAPELQVWLGGRAEPVGRVDFYWRQFRTIAEVDGDLKYKDPERAKAQLLRDSYLRAEGFEVVHFDWNDIWRTPDAVAAAIREAFRRSALLAARSG
jgi:Transcriptional regulator, AbiEi antitoxin/Protein of unknown function (DUF559)